MKVDEATMRQRRLDRLRHVDCFMSTDQLDRILAKHAVLHLLTGWFQNSHWVTAWWVIKQAWHHSWVRLEVKLTVFWHMRVMGRTSEDLDEIFLSSKPR